MEKERINQKTASRIIKQKQDPGINGIMDNRPYSSFPFLFNPTAQRLSEDDEETMQGKFDSSVLRMEKEDEETLQGKFESPVQRASEEDEDTLQGKFDKPIQKKNETGMPDNLKVGIESLSGFSMDDVRVYYNSTKPATVQALAYTQGTDIYVAPGQEKHLPHEAWHVAQQKAGRVSPNTSINGLPANDNPALEYEADVMGAKAVQCKKYNLTNVKNGKKSNNIIQYYIFTKKGGGKIECKTYKELNDNWNNLSEDQKQQLNAAFIYQGNDLYDDVNIIDCHTINDIVSVINIYKTSRSYYKITEEMKNEAFKEAHNNDTIEKYQKKQEEINRFNDFCDKEITNIYYEQKIFFKNKRDFIHQIAQDYRLKTIFDGRYKQLIGQKNSFSDFYYNSDYNKSGKSKFSDLSKSEEESKPAIKKIEYDKLVVYRNFDLSTIQKKIGTRKPISLFGGSHGGALGTALFYANQRGFQKSSDKCSDVAIVKVVINNVNIQDFELDPKGEGKDAKTEASSILPLDGFVKNGNDESSEYHQFSLDFSPDKKLCAAYVKKNGYFEVIYSCVHSSNTYQITDGKKTYDIKPDKTDLNDPSNYEVSVLNYDTDDDVVLKANGKCMVEWYKEFMAEKITVGTQGRDFVLKLHDHCKDKKIQLKKSDMGVLLQKNYRDKKLTWDFTLNDDNHE